MRRITPGARHGQSDGSLRRIKSLSCFASYLASQDTLRYLIAIKGDVDVSETIEIQLKNDNER